MRLPGVSSGKSWVHAAVAALAVALSAYALYFMVQRFAEFSLEHDARCGISARAATYFAPISRIARTSFAVARTRCGGAAHMADWRPPRPVARPALVGTEVVETGGASETLNRSREAPPILVALPAAQGEASRTLELVIRIPVQMYEDFLLCAPPSRRNSRSIACLACWSALSAPVPDVVLAILAVAARGWLSRGG